MNRISAGYYRVTAPNGDTYTVERDTSDTGRVIWTIRPVKDGREGTAVDTADTLREARELIAQW